MGSTRDESLPPPSGAGQAVKRRRPSESRVQRREAKREHVLTTAMEVVQREGVDALTIARLAAELGCAVGAIYRYFDGKAALLVALQEEAIGELEGEVREALALEAGQPPLARLLAVVRAVVRGPITHPARHRLIDGLMSSPHAILPDDALRRVNGRLDPLLDTVAALLDACADTGALTHGASPLRTRVLWAALHGIDHFRKRDRAEREENRAAAVRREMLGAILKGWGGKPAAIDALLAQLDD